VTLFHNPDKRGPTDMRTTRRHRGFSLVEIVIVVAVLLILASLVLPRSSSASSQAEAVALRSAVATVRRKLMEHYAAHATFPQAIHPAWFAGGSTPHNAFDPPPPTPILIDGTNDPSKTHPAGKLIQPTGAFWYNPANGAFRARIIDMGDEPRNLKLYNSVNGTRIAAWEQVTD
jgi:prepilin-type N-terminal cleavage/methylation domain-containing protein